MLLIDEKIRLEIEKNFERDQGKSVEIGNICKIRTRKKRLALRISQNMIREILRRVISRKRGLTRMKIFEEAIVLNANRERRCRVLRTLAKDKKSIKLAPLSKYHKEEHLCEEVQELIFLRSFFNDQRRATLDGHDGWMRGWFLHRNTIDTT